MPTKSASSGARRADVTGFDVPEHHGDGFGLASARPKRRVVSSTGAPWWVTRLYMGDPVRRQIARGIKPLVSRKASFRMLTLYDIDRMTEQRAGAFLDRLEQAFRRF
ncbi:MAG: hypothetical protein M3178_14870 [Pseudomonadota bacterium]|nr:hypothetical protein [Pseudomonadota bacterium]